MTTLDESIDTAVRETSNYLSHTCITPKTCKYTHELDNCPVCDWGLAICSVCGAGEIQLYEHPCKPKEPS
jgi:hypothetical protein